MIVGEEGMVASEILSVGDGDAMTPMSIREYAEAMRRGYLGAGRREKGRLLTDFCKITGYHRDSAIRLLNKAPVPTAGRRGRPREYSVGVAEALRRLWETVHRICSKNLEGLIPTLLESMGGSRGDRLVARGKEPVAPVEVGHHRQAVEALPAIDPA